jgi:hypothetical protein
MPRSEASLAGEARVILDGFIVIHSAEEISKGNGLIDYGKCLFCGLQHPGQPLERSSWPWYSLGYYRSLTNDISNAARSGHVRCKDLEAYATPPTPA